MKRRQRQEPNFYSSDVYNAFPLRQMEFRFMDCDLRRFYDFRLAIFFSGRTEIISVNFMTDIGHISDEKLRDVSFMKFFVIASAAENCTRRRTSPRMCRRGVFLLACFPSLVFVRSERRRTFSCDFKFVLNSLKPLRRDTIRVEFIFPH